MKPAPTALATGVSTFLATQIVLWYVQPGGCTFGDLFAERTGCQVTPYLYMLHTLVAFLASILAINTVVWWQNRKNRNRNRPRQTGR